MDFLFDDNDDNLNGRNGSNRGRREDSYLSADNDNDAIQYFLRRHRNYSIDTIRAYEKEIYRLRLWSNKILHKPISSLTSEDISAYEIFLKNPPAEWCGQTNAPRFSKEWKPFTGPLTEQTHRQAMVTLVSVMKFLVDAGYLAKNPMWDRHYPRKATVFRQRDRIEGRSFTKTQWKALELFLGTNSSFEHERARFCVALMYFLALRIGDVANHCMNAFEYSEDDNQWWFRVIGKGKKEAKLPVPFQMLAELKRYRKLCNLPELPERNEQTPLVFGSNGKAIGKRRISQIIKDLMESVAETLPDGNAKSDMRLASAHWFRHTSITKQANSNCHPDDVLKNARHSDVQTLMLYKHGDELRRYEGVQSALVWNVK